MLIVKARESRSVQKRLFILIDRDCTEIVKLYSPQREGNKDYEAHRCEDFSQPSNNIYILYNENVETQQIKGFSKGT